MNNLFLPLSNDSLNLQRKLLKLIDDVFPIPSRFKKDLHRDVADLSRLFTSNRDERGKSYLGKPALLSAYLRYFLPWNIYRLCRLLPSLPLTLKANDAINDLGSGPLTFAAALWISRPELRKLPLEIRCIDKTPAILEAGKKLFMALTTESGSGKTGTINEKHSKCPWTIKTIRGEVKNYGNYRLSTDIRGKPAALTTAINLYNEIFWDFSLGSREKLQYFADCQGHLLSSITEGAILVLEPGIPRSGEFISLLRDALYENGHYALAPCTHNNGCPLTGGFKKKWCHFAFDTEDAPPSLHKLSEAAGLPKERAVLSFIYTDDHSDSPAKDTALAARVCSDAFPIKTENGQNSWGRYACSEKGLILLYGSRREVEAAYAGELVKITTECKKDKKSGAILAPLLADVRKV